MALSTILDMFAKSPIRPIQKHMQKALTCVEHLQQFMDAAMAQDWETAGKEQENITTLERQADALKREMRLNLPKGIFLPVPRSDILALITAQDEVANKAEDIAGLIYGRRMTIPDQLSDLFKEYMHRAVDATVQANIAINELDELLETGFSGSEVTLVETMIEKLAKIESETDSMQVRLRHGLFQIESTLPPVDVIFLYKVIEWVGSLADTAQQVGNRLEILLAH